MLGQEGRASGCTRGHLDWILGETSAVEELLSVEQALRRGG